MNPDYTLPDSQQERSLRELLNTKFNRYEFVGIKNILTHEFTWTVALEQNEILNMSPSDMNEDEMIRRKSGTFLPGDGVTRNKQKVVVYKLQPGEKKMILGEAAYPLVDKIFTLYIKEKYIPQVEPGTVPDKHQLALTKSAMAKLKNPQVQTDVLKEIIVGPIINNVAGALNTLVNEKMDQLEGFSDVQTQEPRGRAAKAKATA